MAEDVKVLQISTEKSVANVRELRDYIKQLKTELNDENKSLKDNAKSAEELRKAQGALKDAMYATTKSADDLIAGSQKLYSATGELTGSYNDLVHELAELKSAWRSTTDETERAKLADEIKRVNDALKGMDEATGSFKRNVGNYTESMKKALQDIPSFAQPVKRALDDVNKTMGLMGKQPILAIITLLLPVIQKITAALKDNETAQQAVQKVTQALQPVMEAARSLIEKIAGWISKATDRVLEWASQSTGGFRTFIEGAVGVGNAVKEFLLTPIRQTISAVRGLGKVFDDIFKGKFDQIRRDANDAINGIQEAFEKGLDFKGNFAKGKEAGAAFIDGLSSQKERAKDTGVEVGTAAAQGVADGFADTLEKEKPKLLDAIAIMERYDRQQEALRRDREERNRQLQAEIEAEIEAETQAVTASLQEWLDELDRAQAEAFEKQQAYLAARKQTFETYVYSVSDILGSLADIMEAEGEGSERVAKQVKNIRIAAATIDTIAGAVKAYMSAMTLPPPLNIAMGVANAAVVTAAGLAQIAKIRNTQISKSSSSAATPSVPSGSAAPSVPTLPETVQQSTMNELAYNTQELNRRTGDQRVYILQSDLEASGKQVAVRQGESTF